MPQVIKSEGLMPYQLRKCVKVSYLSTILSFFINLLQNRKVGGHIILMVHACAMAPFQLVKASLSTFLSTIQQCLVGSRVWK